VKPNTKPHYHVTAGLIWKDGKLLISKRAKGSHLEGFWEFPGGKQEAGEELSECLEREIEEELGIEARVDAPLLTVDHEYGEKRISLHVFNCTWVKGEPTAIGCQEIRWVEWNALSALRFPPPDIKAIERLTREKGAGSREQGAGSDGQPATSNP
jgi:mutator protein MutT